MTSFLQKTSSSLIALLSATSLIACGGGGALPENAYAATSAVPVDAIAVASLSAPATAPEVISEVAPAAAPVLIADAGIPNALAATVTAVSAANTTDASVTPVKAPGTITNLALESTASLVQTNVPVTFGQVFAKGDLMPGMTVYGVLGDGTRVPLQIDAKAHHADGSLRHAVISTVLPQLASHQTQVLSLDKNVGTAKVQQNTPAALINAGFRTAVSIKIGDQTYTASADELLKSAKYTTWLSGPLVNEWMVSAPLKTAQGTAHPHLSARFAIRSYTGLNKARVDVTVENTWAYEPSPQNYTYDVQITVGPNISYSKTGLTHFHHARWRKLAWWGAAPEVHIKHNQAYLIGSRAVPNYDQTIKFAESTFTSMSNKFVGAAAEPMGAGIATAYMATTGGRNDIGLIPGWAATYLLSMDKRAKDITLNMGDLAGSWSAHYRDKVTDRPISIVNYPYMTIFGRATDAINPSTKKSEAFPECASTSACKTPNYHDTAHQPAFAYLPYLVTGDYFYLEELQFWTMWNLLSYNPGYRSNVKGLIWSTQLRGQAWNMRTLSEAAYITPDADPLKVQFEAFLSNNLDWYNNTYSNNASANALGAIVNQTLNDGGRSIAPWQDDFFTSAIGHAAELGYVKAAPLLAWKAKLPIARMTGPGVCWIGSNINYTLYVKESATSPFYSSMANVYQASNTPEFDKLTCGGSEMAAYLKLKVGEMVGYSSSEIGFPSNMQPALAYSADAIPNAGKAAWKVFMARSVKPNYGLGPQFAIVPR